MKIMAVINQKGGVGKTAISTNQAAELAAAGMNVLFIDMDPQSHASRFLSDGNTDFSVNIGHLLSDASIPIEQAILQSHIPGIHYIPTERTFSAVQIQLFSKTSREQLLAKRLRGLSYDIVILDCPPDNSLATTNAICASSHFLVPTDNGSDSLHGLGHLLALINEIKSETGQASYNWRVLRNMIQSTAKKMNSFLDSELAEVKDNVLKTAISRSEIVSQAHAMALPVRQYRPGSISAQQMLDLSREVKKWVEQE